MQAARLTLCPTSFLVQLFLFCCNHKERWTEAVLWEESQIANCENVGFKERSHRLENSVVWLYFIFLPVFQLTRLPVEWRLTAKPEDKLKLKDAKLRSKLDIHRYMQLIIASLRLSDLCLFAGLHVLVHIRQTPRQVNIFACHPRHCYASHWVTEAGCSVSGTRWALQSSLLCPAFLPPDGGQQRFLGSGKSRFCHTRLQDSGLALLFFPPPQLRE